MLYYYQKDEGGKEMKEIKRVYVESKLYKVEELEFKNWKNIRIYVNYQGYKKQGIIEVRVDGLYLDGVKGIETDRGIEFKDTRWLSAYIGFNNDHCVVVEFAEEKKVETAEEEKVVEEITFERKKEGLFLLVGGKVRDMLEIRQQGKYWLVENAGIFRTEEEAIAAAKKALTSKRRA